MAHYGTSHRPHQLLGGDDIPPLDLGPDMLATLGCTDIGTFHQLCFESEVGVFDHVTKPAGDITVLQVEHPRFIVDAVSHLDENGKILRFEVELAFRSPEVETKVGRKLTFRIFPPMPPTLDTRQWT